MKKDLAQLNFIEDILNLIDTAWSTNTKSSKLMLNFSADLSPEDQVNLLNDLKKKQAIQDFKKQTDYFDLFSPSHDILLREYDRLKPRYQEVKLPNKPAGLKGQVVSYDDKEIAVKVGNFGVLLPASKNEQFFCRAMFKYPASQPVDWTIVYQEITGLEPSFDNKKQMQRNKRTVQDTMYRVNNRIKEDLDINDNLFVWDEKTVKRLY